MTGVYESLEGSRDSDLLIVADHASNRIPAEIDLGLPLRLLDEHIAVDIGVDPLARALSRRLDCPALIAGISRLVVDLNRDPDDPNTIPQVSDGRHIPGNQSLSEGERSDRLARFWWPYHEALAAAIERLSPQLIVNLHSFTPRLASRPDEERPWQIGILYNGDDRAARIAITMLRSEGIATGDNEPYSGRHLNATMNRHAESRGLPYVGIEVRQDLIDHSAGVEKWCVRLAGLMGLLRGALA